MDRKWSGEVERVRLTRVQSSDTGICGVKAWGRHGSYWVGPTWRRCLVLPISALHMVLVRGLSDSLDVWTAFGETGWVAFSVRTVTGRTVQTFEAHIGRPVVNALTQAPLSKHLHHA